MMFFLPIKNKKVFTRRVKTRKVLPTFVYGNIILNFNKITNVTQFEIISFKKFIEHFLKKKLKI